MILWSIEYGESPNLGICKPKNEFQLWVPFQLSGSSLNLGFAFQPLPSKNTLRFEKNGRHTKNFTEGRNTKKLEKKGRHTETSQNALRCENMVGAPKTSRKSWNTKTLKRVVDTPKWATIQSNVERNPKHKLRSSKYTSTPRARAKTTGCRSAGLGPLGSKGLALFFRRRGIHICHQNDSWNLPARVINRIPTFWLPL